MSKLDEASNSERIGPQFFRSLIDLLVRYQIRSLEATEFVSSELEKGNLSIDYEALNWVESQEVSEIESIKFLNK